MEIHDSLEQILGIGRVKVDETLARYTTLKFGGSAKYFFSAQNSDELLQALKAAFNLKLPYWVLGGGSNIVISDKGLPGLVIRNESRSIKILKRLGKMSNGEIRTQQALVEVDTGVLINALVRYTCDEGFGGLERHLGLPGTVGGALYMNSKWTKPDTYIGDVLYSAKIWDNSGDTKIVDKKYFKFGYDQSIIQKTKEIVLSATFLLTSQPSKELWNNAHSSMEYRKESQPMGFATAGCTFRNISLSDAMRIPTPANTKSAGYLVDQVGLKGYKIGNIKFSDKHANFMINLGDGKAKDAKALIDEAKRRVKEKFGVSIETEVVLLGEFD